MQLKYLNSRTWLLTLCVSFNFIQSLAQPENVTLHHSLNALYLDQLYNLDSSVHTSMRPFLRSEFNPKIDADMDRGLFLIKRKEKIEKDILEITPLINLMIGADSWKNSISKKTELNYHLSNGLSVDVAPGDKFFVNVNYMFAYSVYPRYFREASRADLALQGYGALNRSGDAFYNHYLEGYASYSPNHIFNFQTGYGRNFIGEGYRSMLLSDYANNYPYFKISTKVWKLKYTNLYSMQFDTDLYSTLFNTNGETPPFSTFNSKFSSSHYLSLNIGRRLNVGLFESVIWRGRDSTYNRSFDVNYLNPVIFFRPVEYSVGSPDNVLLGLNMSYILFKGNLVYGQLLLDEFLLKEIRAGNGWWANKYGVQLGIKSFYKKFNYQFEINTARPYTYTHSAIEQNYGHFNLPLAHPLGANFEEYLGILRYRFDNIQLEGVLIYGRIGSPLALENNGSYIFRSNQDRENEYGNKTLQGNLNEVVTGRGVFRYFVNADRGKSFSLSVQYRNQRITNLTQNSLQFMVGFRTDLFNRYLSY